MIRIDRREGQVEPSHNASNEEREWHRQEPPFPWAQLLQQLLDPLKLLQATLPSFCPRIMVEDHYTQVVIPFAEAVLHFGLASLIESLNLNR